MKKEKLYKYMYVITILLIVIFAVMIGIDYYNYDPVVTSAPFSANILIRTVEFILPSIIIFIIGLVLKNKYKC